MQTTTRRFASTLGLTCLFASPFALGCIAPTVIGGNEGGAGGGGVAVAVVTTGVSPNTAIAVRSDAEVGIELNRVTISNFGQACPQETAVPECPDQTSASLSFDIPAIAAAGDVLSVNGFYVVAGRQDEGCWGGGGSALATVEVLTADASSLTLRLTGLTGASEVNLEGTYNVPICSGAPLANALAIYRGDLGGSGTTATAVSSVGSGGFTSAVSVGSGDPGSGASGVVSSANASGVSSVASGGLTGSTGASGSGPSANASAVSAVSGGPTAVSAVSSGGYTSASAGSGGGSDDDLFLVIGNGPLVCEDPFGANDTCDAPEYHVSIALPPAYQQPGYYPLSGIANFSAWAPAGNGECQGGGGSYWEGSIRVLHVGDGEIFFALEGTGPISDTVGSADGTYAAPLCYADSGSSVAVSSVGSGDSGAEAVAVTSGY